MAVAAKGRILWQIRARRRMGGRLPEARILQVGYCETPHELCLAGEWDKVRDFWASLRGDQGTATRDLKQIRMQEAIQILGEASPEVVTAVLTLLKQGRGRAAGS